MPTLTDRDYAELLQFRIGLRRFLKWSETQARDLGVSAAQHQLLLAVRGHGQDRGPSIGELADYLLLRHHSTVELVDRAEDAGLVRRAADPDDGRLARVELTELGHSRIEQLSEQHLEELRRLAPLLGQLG